MSDLLHIIPDFPIKDYTHLIPSLEKHLVTTADLLTLDAIDVAKRAQLPTLDIRRLILHITSILQDQLGVGIDHGQEVAGEATDANDKETEHSLKSSVDDLLKQWSFVSTLDVDLNSALGGGIPAGYVTEITGESGVGKTQLLLSLLLSAQLPAPHGLSRPTLYISSEHPLPTNRLQQLLTTNTVLSDQSTSQSSSPPSLNRVLTLQVPDLESQDHILTYQLPVALHTHRIGLVVIDSIAANYRAETNAVSSGQHASAFATRAADLARTGALLRQLARDCDCAVIVANQVSDRFTEGLGAGRPGGPRNPEGIIQQPWSSSPSEPLSQSRPLQDRDDELRLGWAVHPALSLDWQQRFFTGWGNDSAASQTDEKSKTPTLGLVWTNQIACRIALVKEVDWVGSATGSEEGVGTAEWAPRKWRRWARVAFAPWVAAAGNGEKGVEFEIWAGGLRAVGSKKGVKEHE